MISCLTSGYIYIVKIQVKNIIDVLNQSRGFLRLEFLPIAKTTIEKAISCPLSKVADYQHLGFCLFIMNILFTDISGPFLSLRIFRI